MIGVELELVVDSIEVELVVGRIGVELVVGRIGAELESESKYIMKKIIF